ncbi:enoyl-[acyl-carrier protein] reductase I [Nonlabens dokdonensis]|uniref:Enoyl-[acyl-carrier protein] reductase I n=2 Tax=Nonlabens dokdonensis TaxID=328515 RepID=A0ABX5PUV4_9FLAO|nr:SDR family oxidoreductase [Nonlabens dokdonensis]AGC78281.1 putative dehydrogenase/reductase [Nonlabens dokdonensis DSW-6]PZX37831.1 enoyl-[acyl-carrier protein] reductase I [Nonlabens dokdonensis]
MVNDFKNKYALILGGSSGLGYASALKLAQHGMNLIIFYRASRLQADEIEARFEKLRSLNIQLLTVNSDATRENKLSENLLKIKGFLNDHKLSVFLHSISKGNLKPMTGDNTLSSNDFQQTIHSMGISLYSWTKALFEAHLFAKPAKILSFTSEGSTRPMKSYAAVSAAKATLEAINRSIAIEFAPYQITSNCIQAGVTDTLSLSMIPMYEELKQESLKRNPHGELTTPERVANVVYLMSREEASWITGTIIKVDGGESLQ